ncbi:protein FAM24A-like [Dipodomys spectabilis]|uniref:protein FAM24A-like n=1 Tax=Dipodomys spectabilis TaxID=105255 RepID=UPI001C53A504|nr:protein FAM24A-like [Dipodomys spectabilis]
MDLRMVMIIIIGGGILAAMLLLISVIFCLYFKVSKTIKCAEECGVIPLSCVSSARVAQSRVFPATFISNDSPYQAVKCCDKYNSYTGVGRMQPCLCNSKEGI